MEQKRRKQLTDSERVGGDARRSGGEREQRHSCVYRNI